MTTRYVHEMLSLKRFIDSIRQGKTDKTYWVSGDGGRAVNVLNVPRTITSFIDNQKEKKKKKKEKKRKKRLGRSALLRERRESGILLLLFLLLLCAILCIIRNGWQGQACIEILIGHADRKFQKRSENICCTRTCTMHYSVLPSPFRLPCLLVPLAETHNLTQQLPYSTVLVHVELRSRSNDFLPDRSSCPRILMVSYGRPPSFSRSFLSWIRALARCLVVGSHLSGSGEELLLW